jgi:serine/threonine-protein kinase
MATVYAAVDRRLDRPVAVKVLAERYTADPAFVARFRAEARAAAALNHPCAVTVYDWGADGGTHYLVMERLPGPNLKEVLRTRRRLPEAAALDIAACVAAALGAAHERGIVHRDVKPHNVLLDAEGRPKLTDFGIARAAAGAGLTATGETMGSAHYLAPEQASGAAVDHRADLYGLGAVLYELLTGQPPFEGDRAVEVALRHVREPVRPPRSLVPGLSAETEAVVLKALAKDPAGRYQSAAEMRAALERASGLLDGGAALEPTQHLPPGGPADAGAWTRTARPARPSLRRVPWRWVVPVVSGLLLLALLLPALRPAPDCRFVRGFKALRDEIPEVVGACRENEQAQPNGDVLQTTSRGTLIWRKADGATMFTDGRTRWVRGPYGLQKRAERDRFAWEAPGR